MGLGNVFNMPRYVVDDPDWAWFLDPENYGPKLPEFGISEDLYTQAWRELLEVFSLKWARDSLPVEYRNTGYYGIHPHPFMWLSFHPVSKFLADEICGNWQNAVPLLRLGLDLLRTKSIPGVSSIRQDLVSLEQYAGRLFELEVLSDFCQRGLDPQIEGTPDFSIACGSTRVFLEARHRGIPFWMAVAREVHAPWGGETPSLSVEIKESSGRRSDAFRMAAEINEDIERMASTKYDPVDKPNYKISLAHEGVGPGLAVGSVTIGRSVDQNWAEEVEFLVYRTLVEKFPQVAKAAADGNKVALLMDCRSLILPAMPDADDPRNVRREDVKAGILGGGSRFLKEYPVVSGVVWWWYSYRSIFNLQECLHLRWDVTMSTANGHIEHFDPALFP